MRTIHVKTTLEQPMKQPRSTSAAAAVKAMIDAAKAPLTVPGYVFLRPEDEPFWDAIVRARTRDEWSECDFVVAAQLARCMADIERETHVLAAEGSVVRNGRGSLVVNARATVLDVLCRRQMAILRTLRMGGRVAGDARHAAGHRRIQREAERIRAEFQDDDLLA